MAQHKLSARKVDGFKSPGAIGDGAGLWLVVSPAGSRSWVFRYSRGKAHAMGLGAVADVSLQAAREKAAEARKLLGQGLDPIDQRRASATALAKQRGRPTLRPRSPTNTFPVARTFLALERAWSAVADDLAVRRRSPIVGRMRIDEVQTEQVLQILRTLSGCGSRRPRAG